MQVLLFEIQAHDPPPLPPKFLFYSQVYYFNKSFAVFVWIQAGQLLEAWYCCSDTQMLLLYISIAFTNVLVRKDMSYPVLLTLCVLSLARPLARKHSQHGLLLCSLGFESEHVELLPEYR